MTRQKLPFRDPATGQIIEADIEPVEITEIVERPTVVTLADGARVRVKVDVADASRFVDRYDQEGLPIYNLKTAIVITLLDAPEGLKQT